MPIQARASIAIIAAFVPIAFAAGCRTTGTERAARAAESLESLQAEIGKTSDGLGASVVALNDLVKSPQPDLKPQFDAFTRSMDALEARIEAVKSRSAAMEARGQEYFKAWEESSQTLSSPEMKEYSEGRRKQLNESYEKIQGDVARVSDLGKPLMDSLRDLRKVLSMDLTASGLTLAAAPAEKANASAAELKAEVEKLLKDLDEVAKMLSPPKAQK